MVRICHASIDENGKARGGSPGDQTAKEVCIRSWYNKPWGLMLRHPKKEISDRMVEIAVLIANSNHVGYNQNSRNSFHDSMKKFNHDVMAYLSANLRDDTDCSAFITEIAIAAGVLTLEYKGNAPTTSTMEKAFKNAGFKVEKDLKYLTSDRYLKKGDILVAPGQHTVIVIDDPEPVNTNDKYFPKYTGKSVVFLNMLDSLGIDSSSTNREKIYKANFPGVYKKTYEQNVAMMELLKEGKLKRP